MSEQSRFGASVELVIDIDAGEEHYELVCDTCEARLRLTMDTSVFRQLQGFNLLHRHLSG